MLLALAGDTMLGRGVADAIARRGPRSVVADEVVEVASEADLFVLNLECCISERGAPWPAPGKPFFFRAPPAAVETLLHLGVDCVTLGNNHALDYGYDALMDTFAYLREAGIAWTGAGADVESARAPARLEAQGARVMVVGASDHPDDFAAAPDLAGVALAPFQEGVPEWLLAVVRDAAADAVVVSPHWGPNMTAEPPAYVRSAARELIASGATIVAGHSAHVFHGVGDRVLYDLGDFVDDYAVDPVLRNDLGLLFLVTIERRRAVRVEAVPLELAYCHTRLASREPRRWIARRFRDACLALGTEVDDAGDRLTLSWG